MCSMAGGGWIVRGEEIEVLAVVLALATSTGEARRANEQKTARDFDRTLMTIY